MKPENDAGKLSKMGRRRFMENLGALGVSAAALNWLSQDEIADVTYNPKKEVPSVEKYETIRNENGVPVGREPVFETVERQKWQRLEATEDALRQVQSQLPAELDLGTDVKTAFMYNENSPVDYGIEVHVLPESEDPTRDVLEELLPTTLNGVAGDGRQTDEYAGIPLDVKDVALHQADGFLNECYDYEGETYDPVPGGAPIKIIEDCGNGCQNIRYGTVTGAFYDTDLDQVGWITAGHLATAYGQSVYHETTEEDVEGNADLIGDVQYYEKDYCDPDSCDTDFAFIKPTSDEGVRYSIASENYDKSDDLTQKGIITDQGLQNHVGDSGYVSTQGRVTCRNSAHIEGFYDNGVDQSVLTSKAVRKGDSGGPVFNIDGTDAYIAGTIGGDYDDGSDFNTKPDGTWATTAETIEEFGGSF